MPVKNTNLEDNPLWYKDAIIYELHVKSFCDSNNDGIGDFRGLITKLDYLQSLGITAIWLLPFYPSPLKDDGYDIADYFSINPTYGTLRDFKDFLNLAHKNGIRVITELVLNHTSDQNPWFQKSRNAKKGSPWRDFYVWSDTPTKYKEARIIFQDFETSNWSWDNTAKAYYWHRFYSHQPDLNFDNPKVQKMMISVIDFWLEMGVDGLRLDAVPYLFEREGTNCENLPETHDFLKKLRDHINKKFKDKMLLAEANQWSEDAVAYFGQGDECHMSFNFPVMPRMFMALQMEDKFPITNILDSNLTIPDTCQWAIFLRNHDELTLEMVTDEERDYMYRFYAEDPRSKVNLGIRRRLAPLLWNNRRKIEVLNMLLFSLPGTPVIYYGDEIGMGDNYYLGDRDGVRTPMQWSPDRNAGFSKENPQKLFLPVIIDPEYHYESINVENQERNLTSLLWWMKRVIQVRKKYKAFGRGEMIFIESENPKVLSFIRKYNSQMILVIINLSRFSQVAELDLSKYTGYIPEEIFSKNKFPTIKETKYIVTLVPHSHYWLLLTKRKVYSNGKPEAKIPTVSIKSDLSELLTGNLKKRLEQEILINYIKKCRWFRGKSKMIYEINIKENMPFFNNRFFAHFIIVQIKYNHGEPEMYFIPLCLESRNKGSMIKKQFPEGVITKVEIGEEEGVLYDGVYNPEFHDFILNLMIKKKKLKGESGEFIVSLNKALKNFYLTQELPIKSYVLSREQSNTSIVYKDTFMLKLFRKLDFGINPDAEIKKVLNEKSKFKNIPKFSGLLEYKTRDSKTVSVGLLELFVENSRDCWTYFLDNVGQYYEKILSKKSELEKDQSFINFDPEQPEKFIKIMDFVGGFFSGMVRILGQRTGELHLSLFKIKENKDFTPEPFSLLYQKSLYQSVKNLTKQVFTQLRSNKANFPSEIKPEITKTMENEEAILNYFKKIIEKKISSMKIRIHGDYHLGQVLFTGNDFVLIDFEGEPARPISERRLKRSPLRDIAGMIRSFHYVAYAGLLRNASVLEDDKNFLEPWLNIWHKYITSIFLNSYKRTVHDAPFLPKKESDFKILLDTFLLEKAVYELGYELNNRPDWLMLPITGINYILKSHNS